MTAERRIAIVGLAGRFPGAADSAQFWSLLSQARHAIAPIPPDRWSDPSWYAPWPPQPGRSYVREAGLLHDVQGFDAGFFGIAPREAEQMDPQQRILLEVAWDALESAGETREGLRGSRTGVFVGLASVDYARIQPAHERRLDAYWATGNAASIAANRLSYAFDLRGPSLVVDTACSSSLVAVHLACQALRSGAIDRAVVGGANLILSPDLMVVFSAANMLARDARCKTFDARADGYVRGEGCGVVVLKRLPDALAARDPIVALVRGSATNQDGRSNGLTAPNGQAQQAVIEDALADAELPVSAIDAVELHGTGTSLGDPIEALALGAVLGNARPGDRPCRVGSVKTNIGHLEAAAGIAGLIKSALALQHRFWPASLNFECPNPAMSLSDLGLAVATSPSRLDDPARIGVSSFGFGGTNAHVVLESAPAAVVPDELPRNGPFVLPVSARTPDALRDMCARFAEALASTAPSGLRDFLFTASVRRTHYEHRIAVTGDSPADLAAGLARLVAGDTGKHRRGRRPPAGPRRLALWLAPLHAVSAAEIRDMSRWSLSFRRHCDSLAPVFAAHGLPADLLEREVDEPALVRVRHAAVLAGLAAEVRHWGLAFVTVAGAGIGADVAAWYRGEWSMAQLIGAVTDDSSHGENILPVANAELVAIGGPAPAGIARAAEIDAVSSAHLLGAQADLFVQGHALDWNAIHPHGRTVPLPGYAWQRQRFWFKSHEEAREPAGTEATSTDATTALDAKAASAWTSVPSSTEDRAIDALDRVCAAFTREALTDLGVSPADFGADPDRLIERCGIAPQRAAVFRRHLARLAKAEAAGLVGAQSATAMLDALRAAEPLLSAELDLLRRMGPALAAVLRGTVDPLTLLFPDGDVGNLRRLFGEAPAARNANRILVEAVRTALSRRPQTRPLRILEIGAGTGGTTSALLAGLADVPHEYVFSDVSEHFLSAAAGAFGTRVVCRRFDIEMPPGDQDLADGGYDLVVAANVLHATRSLRDSIAHARQLLVPDGSLVLIEATQASWALELTFGLTDGWWRFDDFDLRPEQPLLDAAGWRNLLTDAGLHGARIRPCDPRALQSVIWADAAPSDRQKQWLLLGAEAELAPVLAEAIRDHGGAPVLAEGTGTASSPSGAGDAGARPWDYVVDLRELRDGWDESRAGRTFRSDFPSSSVWTVTASCMDIHELTCRSEADIAREGGRVDLDRVQSDRAALAVLCAIEAHGASREIAIRDGRVLVRREGTDRAGIPASVDAVIDVANPARKIVVSTPGASDLARRLASAFAIERPALLEAELTQLVAAILKLAPGEVDPERGLQDQGMDSLMALELRGQLQRLAAVQLPATLVLEKPSVRSLAAHLLPLLQRAEPLSHHGEFRPMRAATAPPVRLREDLGETGVPGFIARIAALSDDEVYRRLLASGRGK
jgi:acyl transferase domain-containing protein/SAM-dependent methyltransferase/acyl carrier protein